MRIVLLYVQLAVGLLLMFAAFDKPLLLAAVLTCIGFGLAYSALRKREKHIKKSQEPPPRKAALIGDKLVHPKNVAEEDIDTNSSDVVSLGSNIVQCTGCGRPQPVMLTHSMGRECCEKCAIAL